MTFSLVYNLLIASRKRKENIRERKTTKVRQGNVRHRFVSFSCFFKPPSIILKYLCQFFTIAVREKKNLVLKFLSLTKYFDRKDYECRYMLLPQYFSFSFFFFRGGQIYQHAPSCFLSFFFSLVVLLRYLQPKKIYLLSHQDVYNGQFNKIYFLGYFSLKNAKLLTFSFFGLQFTQYQVILMQTKEQCIILYIYI